MAAINELARFFEGKTSLDTNELSGLLASPETNARQIPEFSAETVKSWFEPSSSSIHQRDGAAYENLFNIPKLNQNGGNLPGDLKDNRATATEDGVKILDDMDRVSADVDAGTLDKLQNDVIYKQTYVTAQKRLNDLVAKGLEAAGNIAGDTIPKAGFEFFLKSMKALLELRTDRLIPYYHYKRS